MPPAITTDYQTPPPRYSFQHSSETRASLNDFEGANWGGQLVSRFQGEALDRSLSEVQRSGVEIPNPPEVREFLLPFPAFVSRLPEICQLVQEITDAETSHLSLEVWTSIEEGDSMLTLWQHRPTPQPGFNDILDCKLDAHYEWIVENDIPFNVNLAFPRRSDSIAGF